MVQLYIACILNGLVGSYGSAGGLMIYFITPNPNERNLIMTIQQFFKYFSGWLPAILSVAVTYVPRLYPGVLMQDIYKNYAYVFFVLSAIAAIYKFLNTRERFPLPSREEMKSASIWSSVKFAVSTRPFLVTIVGTVFGGLDGELRSSSENFFWLNNTGSLANGFLASLLTGLPKYFITPFVPKAIKRFGERNVYVAGHLWAGLGFLAMWLIGYNPFGKKKMAMNVFYLALSLMTIQLPNALNGVASNVMKADTFDYIEWKHGVRSEGLVSAANNWFNKLNGSLQGFIAGTAYQIIKFKPLKNSYGNLIPQTNPGILSGIWFIFALVPAFSNLMVAVSYMFFNVHGKFKEDISAGLFFPESAFKKQTMFCTFRFNRHT
jgi:Na+/melibiose symporter-like transporter